MHNSYCISVMYILCNWTRLSIAITIINIRNLWDNFIVWVFVVLQAFFILEIVKTVYKSILFPTGQTSNHVLDYCKCDIWLWIVPIAVWKHANGELGVLVALSVGQSCMAVQIVDQGSDPQSLPFGTSMTYRYSINSTSDSVLLYSIIKDKYYWGEAEWAPWWQ